LRISFSDLQVIFWGIPISIILDFAILESNSFKQGEKMKEEKKMISVPKSKVVDLIANGLGTAMTMKDAKAILLEMGKGQDLVWKENTRGNLTAWKKA